MTKQDEKALMKRVAKRAAVFGFLLAIACNLLPHDYRVVCHSIANVCMGG